MTVSRWLAFMSVLALIQFTAGFIMDDDCIVSQWTAWSGPHVYGMIYRERQIVEHPPDGDEICKGRLYEVDLDPNYAWNNKTVLPISIRADLIIDNFLRPQYGVHRKRGSAQQKGYRDLLLVVDSSGSIGSTNFHKAMLEVSTLLSTICPSPDPFLSKYNRLALLEFSSTNTEVFDFQTFQNSSQIMDKIRNLKYIVGATHTGSAFSYATSNIFKASKGMRKDPNVKQEVLIVTDGMSNGALDAINEASKLQQVADVFGLMIGVTSPKGQQEVRSYVSRKIVNHLFAASSFTDLTALVQEVLRKLRAKPQLTCVNVSP